MKRRTQGSVTQKKGLWYGVADLGRDARGKRCRKWTRGCKTRREAERALAHLIVEGIPTPPARFALAALVENYIVQAKAQGRERSTIQRYYGLLRTNIQPHVSNTSAATVHADLIEQLYADLRAHGLSATSIAHVHGLLTATFRWARRRGIVERDPMLSVNPPKRSLSSAKALRPEDARRFFSLLPGGTWKRWEPLFLFALATGMRRGEVLALRQESIDLTRRIVLVAESLAEVSGDVFVKSTKTRRVREVPLSDLALEALRQNEAIRESDKAAAQEFYQDHDLVFADPLGRHIRPMAFTDAFRRAATAAGLRDVTLHMLRHTAATWLLAGGADVKTASAILGHDPATLLRTYAHVITERQHAAASLIGATLRPTEPIGRTIGRTKRPERQNPRGSKRDSGGSANGNRTRLSALKGRCPNR
jgi:integrase